MGKARHERSFREELDAVFAECQEHINCAVRDYQQDIRRAFDELKDSLLATDNRLIN
jgi:hypothetical protein